MSYIKRRNHMEIGATYTHKESNMTVLVKDIEYTGRGMIVWFVLDVNDPCATWFSRSEQEFKSKFNVAVNKDMRQSLDEMIARYGVEAVLKYVGNKYKESIL